MRYILTVYRITDKDTMTLCVSSTYVDSNCIRDVLEEILVDFDVVSFTVCPG